MKPLNRLADLIGRLPTERGIVMHSAAGHPTRLARQLAQEAEALRGRCVYALFPQGAVPYAESPARDLLRLVTHLPGAGLRAALDAGRVTARREPLSTVPGAFARREFPVGAVLLRTSPPDAEGKVSFGVSVDYLNAALAAAEVVIAEVDPRMPRVAGDGWLDAGRIDAWLDAEDGPHAVAPQRADAVDQAIAAHVASLVEDGAVLQLGVGALPDQVLAQLGHLRHLGLHTGIISDAARPLIASGVIDNSLKEVSPGVSVATMALGSAEFYAFLDRNPAIELRDCAVTHDGEILRRLTRLTAVNSALQIDLAGRVNAEWVGTRRVAVPGGLTDFARAASAQPRGCSIVALRSTDRTGGSTILPSLPRDVPPSLEPGEVDFFVTEFGVAPMRSASAEGRRKALVAIAHPAHRDALART